MHHLIKRNINNLIKQQVALISFIFNFGSEKFQASTLRHKLNRVEYLAAVAELLR
ncbi:glycoside hydrolase family protein [Rickettsia tillamookensis]|uniref:glycoside hydrolase family protein n=1 Tax=Rickettsia tillamookensis TaxID=2761623 RepID=UPI003978A87C